MYDHSLYKEINTSLRNEIDFGGKDNLFYTRFLANAKDLSALFNELYAGHPNEQKAFRQLIQTILNGYKNRQQELKQKDEKKADEGHWFLSSQLAGMSLYVDRFCGNLSNLKSRLSYFEKLGINFLHLMPLFESPANESDGGYAVSDFRKIDARFGTMEDLEDVQDAMRGRGMFLMMDIVLNHTSRQHEWAKKATAGDKYYQDFFYFFDDRQMPDAFDQSMPEIFPESAPGNFTWVPECQKWVMSVFHHYQWDLNYRNPLVFVEMLDNIFFYANLGVDLLRIDAPAFIWKQVGTTCQNLPQAHTILQLIKLCVEISAPGMAILGEAIVAPAEIMKYFGTGQYTARECDFAYNATQMALQWDALATGDVRVMMAAQHELLKKPLGTSWITYTRSHDDIGLGYENYMIEEAGWNAFDHRNFLKNFYSGNFAGSFSSGALFSSNPKTGDARISGTLASLCGLEKALNSKNERAVDMAVRRILLMQAQSFFIGGMPMLFYGDETGTTNDYSYQGDPGKSYDNRWMHRPVIHWEKMKRKDIKGSPEEWIFSGTRKLLELRRKFPLLSDLKNLSWLTAHNVHVASFVRKDRTKSLFFLFNFSSEESFVTWYLFREHGNPPVILYDHWHGKQYTVGADNEYLVIAAYSFCILEPVE